MTRRGGVLSSGMEYPGRYSRWHLAYVDPCVEIVARGGGSPARALNERGAVLLPVIGAALLRAGVGEPGAASRRRRGPQPGVVAVVIPEPDGPSPRRSGAAAPPCSPRCARSSPRSRAPDPHLGLYGAFGYDLAFQFEPVRLRQTAPDDQRDLVLHLPDELYVLDRKRETALRYSATSSRRAATPPRGCAAAAAAPGPGRPRRQRPGPARASGRSPVPGRLRARWWRRPGSGSPAATCSRWCPSHAFYGRLRVPGRGSTSGCGSATRRRTSSSSTWARGSTWSARRRRCTCG